MMFIQPATLRSPVQPASPLPFRSPLGSLSSPGGQSLIERCHWLNVLDRLLRQCLPPALASRCRLTNLRDGKLVFLVSAGSWHASLRLHGPKLLETARGAGVDARALIVKVATMQPIPQDRTPPAPLSPAARDALRAAASAVNDAELRAQLLQLASLAES